MVHNERNSTDLLHSTDELRRLITDHPDLPLLVFAGDNANCGGDYGYMSCYCVNASVGEYLDCCQTVNDCWCYTDRDDFEKDLANSICDDFEGTDEEWDEHLKQVLSQYEPYWKPCIILYVDN